jgi:mxaJ protein
MSSGFPRLLAVLLLAAVPVEARELRVCADPNNLPFSDANGGGFENKVAAIVANAMGAELSFVWAAQRRGFIRNGLKAGTCDLLPGVSAGLEMLRTTRPYYRSGYVFVTRATGTPSPASLDDERLKTLRLGVQLIGDDGANTPPAQALSRRGIVTNVRGFPVYGDYGTEAPGRSIVDAVADGDIDVALVWGPTAGYFARSARVPLRLSPVTPRIDGPMLPMVFDISMGVRKDDAELLRDVEAALRDRRGEIDAVLADYGVPRMEQVRQAQGPAP